MTIYVDVTVEVEPDEVLDDLDDQDLIDELNSRGYSVAKYPVGDLLNQSDIVWMKWLILENCDMLKDMQARDVYEKLRAMT
jgi:hypothetical protein